MGVARLGFHEAKFDSEDVRLRVPDIEKIVSEAQKLIKKEKSEQEKR